MGRVQIRNQRRIFHRPASKTPNDAIHKSMKIVSHRVRMVGYRITIISDQYGPRLTDVYGSQKVRIQLTFDRNILLELLAQLGHKDIAEHSELRYLQHYLGI